MQGLFIIQRYVHYAWKNCMLWFWHWIKIRESVAFRIYITGSDVFLIEGESQIHTRCATEEMGRGEGGGAHGRRRRPAGEGPINLFHRWLGRSCIFVRCTLGECKSILIWKYIYQQYYECKHIKCIYTGCNTVTNSVLQNRNICTKIGSQIP